MNKLGLNVDLFNIHFGIGRKDNMETTFIFDFFEEDQWYKI